MSVDLAFFRRGEMLRHPITVKDAEEIHKSESIRFFKGLAIGLAISAAISWGIVCLFASFK